MPKGLPSLAMRLARRPALRDKIFSTLTAEQFAVLKYEWRYWARPNQIEPPGDWTTWLFLGGRGIGKTRTGSEWIIENVQSGNMKRIALVGASVKDVRKVIIEGESGILARSPPWFYPSWEPSKRELTWPNGATATTYSDEKPQDLRGPQHDGAWVDELCKFQYAQQTWDMLQLGLRVGNRPRQIVTTTPKNTPVLKDILKRDDTVISTGSTYENAANLARSFFTQIIRKYEGTRLGRQEIGGDLLEDAPGALWQRANLDRNRRTLQPILKRIVIGVDPPGSSEDGADECGIIVAGMDFDGEGYVLADLSAGGMTPEEWASKVNMAYDTFQADLIVAEKNQGGEMVSSVLRHANPNLPIKLVTATKGKAVRAEPVAMVYEQGRVHHLGSFPELEDQMCIMTLDYDRDKQGSPDRLDACVWAFTELMPGRRAREFSIS